MKKANLIALVLCLIVFTAKGSILVYDGHETTPLGTNIIDTNVAYPQIDITENSELIVSNGSVSYFKLYDNAQLSILEGFRDTSRLYVYNQSNITIYGNNFQSLQIENDIINGTTISADDYSELSVSWLSDGNQLWGDFKLFDNATITFIPEPATVILLSIGTLVLRCKKTVWRKNDMKYYLLLILVFFSNSFAFVYNAKSVQCGEEHTIVQLSNNMATSCGHSGYSQLGTELNNNEILELILDGEQNSTSEYFGNIEHFDAGWKHSIDCGIFRKI